MEYSIWPYSISPVVSDQFSISPVVSTQLSISPAVSTQLSTSPVVSVHPSASPAVCVHPSTSPVVSDQRPVPHGGPGGQHQLEAVRVQSQLVGLDRLRVGVCVVRVRGAVVVVVGVLGQRLDSTREGRG